MFLFREIVCIQYTILTMSFISRHVANLRSPSVLETMLKQTNVRSLEPLIELCGVKNNVTLDNSNTIPAKSEEQSLKSLSAIIDQNIETKCFLGLGYNDVTTPSPIKRHILQNPQWYTAYTPYQAEISQGRLESQYNYQEVVKDLTGLPIANASLLDNASATGEAMSLSYAYFKKKKDTIIVSDTLHPQILGVLETRAKNLNIKLEIMDLNNETDLNTCYDRNRIANVIFQYPDTFGDISIPNNYLEWSKQYDTNSSRVLTTAVCDLLALTKVITPGELNLDIAVGTAQRFGIPMWYGGPHPAFFATSKDLVRFIPGRIVGKTRDSQEKPSFRLALQTREQHIKRQAATSNICTSQSLLTNVIAFYAIYNGPSGLKQISKEVNNKAKYFLNSINNPKIINKQFYDTITLQVENIDKIMEALETHNILVRRSNAHWITITFSENTKKEDIDLLSLILNLYNTSPLEASHEETQYDYSAIQLKEGNRRKTTYLQDDIYHRYTTETDLMRYMYGLARKDYTLCDGMIPLGSCTMKLNASYQLEPLLWDKICNVHPYTPPKFAIGYQELIAETGKMLTKLTGFNHISFQPNSGATGEYSGLITIKTHNDLQGNPNRRKCLIPKSAHGTNTASAAIAGLEIVTFDDEMLDDIDCFNDLVKQYSDDLLCLMITYPNTNGVFRDNIEEINRIIHDNGGYVYMDGANMNALLGLSHLGKMGFDICHLNLHKTFCIPHGGGGPGLGPILCNDMLGPHLPGNNILFPKNYNDTCGMVAAAPWSSAALLTIPYLYISAMGTKGLLTATKMAILNSNYLKSCLEDHYTIIDVNKHGFVGHEFIIDVTEFKKYGINDNDIAKRLIDYSFHPPTISWPRMGVLMFEPTESESKEELDRMVNAMISIRSEIQQVIDSHDSNSTELPTNVLKNAPHSLDMISSWDKPYSIDQAFFPVDSLRKDKSFPSVSRVDDLYGDKLILGKK